jgi:hypothetical protein
MAHYAEAVDLIRSHNVKRRHLKLSQIAAFEAAAEAYLKPKRGGNRREACARPATATELRRGV